jgi:hypothetical protein
MNSSLPYGGDLLEQLQPFPAQTIFELHKASDRALLHRWKPVAILLCAVFSPTIGQANALERAEAKFVSASGSPKATRLGGYYKFYPGINGLRGNRQYVSHADQVPRFAIDTLDRNRGPR